VALVEYHVPEFLAWPVESIVQRVVGQLSDNLKDALPTIEELESEAAGLPFTEEEGTEKTNGES
jgi:hypothetical protein